MIIVLIRNNAMKAAVFRAENFLQCLAFKIQTIQTASEHIESIAYKLQRDIR